MKMFVMTISFTFFNESTAWLLQLYIIYLSGYLLAVWYGIIPAIVLLFSLTSLGVALLLCYLLTHRRRKKSRNEEIFVQPNPVYEISGHMRIAVHKNIAYETVHIS